jgi:phosphatidylglycerol:prolipoprotein diacylglycerol transferase
VHPILFEVWGVPIHTYGVLLAAAYLLGLQLAFWRARRYGIDAGKIIDLGVATIVAALVGAKLLLLVVEFRHYAGRPAELWTLVRAGGVFYGGLLLAVPVALWYARRVGLPMWTTADLFAPGIALGQAVGRLGCFTAGCCFGQPTALPWAVTFTSSYAAEHAGTPLNLGLHPTQIYEAGAGLVILAVLLVTERAGRSFPGRTFWLYVLLYAVSRAAIEVFRGDPRGMVGPLSTSQFVSALLVPVAVGMLVRLGRREEAPPPGASGRRRARR